MEPNLKRWGGGCLVKIKNACVSILTDDNCSTINIVGNNYKSVHTFPPKNVTWLLLFCVFVIWSGGKNER